MIRALNIPSSQFNLPQILLYICKKPTSSVISSSPEIDYLLLEKQVEQLQQVQSRTCQQIVEFVDQNREQLISISQKFNGMEDVIKESSIVLTNLTSKIDDYKTTYYKEQAKIQKYITQYEQSLLQDEIIKRSREEAQFLIEFVNDFENFINKNIQNLSFKNKYNIVRLLKKQQYLKGILQHPILKKAVPDYLLLGNILQNVIEEMQFYLGEQLSRVVSTKSIRKKEMKKEKHTQLDEIFIWYGYMGKHNIYYEIIEETLVGRQLTTLQTMLISNKQSLLSGKQEHIVQGFFSKLFTLIQEFPIGQQFKYSYPEERILSIIYKFLNKKELSFLYTYMMPVFPASYSAYVSALSVIKNKSLKAQLNNRHNWNLKIWADVRIKSILDRSGKEKEQKNLSKWIDIVLKKSCMFDGVRNYMIKLLFQLVNRYCGKLQQNKSIQFSVDNANLLVKQISEVREILQKKLNQAYQSVEEELERQTIKNKIQNLVQMVDDSLNLSTFKWFVFHMQMIISTCKKSLENYKNYVITIINAKGSKESINKKGNVFKPLEGYLKNNPQLLDETINFIWKVVMNQTSQYYQKTYIPEIYKYCNTNLTGDQTKAVMERLQIQKKQLQ